MQRVRCDVAEARALRSELNEGRPVLHDSMTQTQIQRSQIFFGVGAAQDDGSAAAAGIVDRGPRQTEHNFGAKTIAELCVDMIGADHPLGQLGPGVLSFVVEAGTTDHRHSVGIDAVERGHYPIERHAPADGFELTVAAHHRRDQPTLAVERLESEPLLIREPTPVDRVGVDTKNSQHLIARRLDGDAGADRVGPSGRDCFFEIPWTCFEAVGLCGQRSDRTDLHRISRKVGGERLVREGIDLSVGTPIHEVNQRVAGDFIRETGAAVTENAALTVEVDGVADRYRLFEVALLFYETGLARSVGHRLVLQWALTALVTDRTVEGMVDQQELKDPVLGFLGDLSLGLHHHVVAHGNHAAWLQARSSPRVHLHQTHPAHPHRVHAGVVTEPGDVGAVALARVDKQLVGVGLDLSAVHGDADRRHISHWNTPSQKPLGHVRVWSHVW